MRPSAIVLVVVLLALASRAWGQEATLPPPPTAQEPAERQGRPKVAEVVALADLHKGDHVNLLMKSGQDFEGHVVAVEPAAVVLDFTFSPQQLAGVVTFSKTEVAVVLRLPELTKEEKADRLERRRQRALEARERWSITVSTDLKGKPEALALTPEQEEERRQAEEEREVARHRAVLEEFPPEQGWGPERLAQIRRRHFILGMPVTRAEWRFWQVFDQWSEAATTVQLYEERRKQEQLVLLILFPPEEGWGPARKQQLDTKQQSEEQLTKVETWFLKDYERWQEAVAAGKTEQQTPEQPTPTPVAPPAPSAPAPTTP